MAGILLLPPAVALLLGIASAISSSRRVTAWSGVATSAVALVVGLVLIATRGAVPELAGGLLRADALSAYLLTVIGAVGLTSTWGGVERGPDGPATRAERRYSALVCVFLGAMSSAVLTDNLGVVWVAIEATTVATAFLVGHRGTRDALEAAWKYVLLGSVGVAIALLGTVLLYAASRSAGTATLSWVALSSGQLAMDPGLIRVAGALAVLGLATKAGLVPMHAWLPDAHSQAPAPVSGLMSGVLLSVAFYAILRVRAVVDLVVGPALMRGMLLTAGLASLWVAAALIWRQRDYKRLLAWSSVEHMGIIAVGAAIGGRLAIAAVLLHVLGHGLAKATAFVVAGRVLALEGTTRIDQVRGLLARQPLLAGLLTVAVAALLGLPPFAPFFSELALAVAGWSAGLGWAVAAMLVALLVVFAGMARAMVAMTAGPGTEGRPADGAGKEPHAEAVGSAASAGRGPVVPLVVALAATAVVGLLAGPVGEAIRAAAEVVT